MPSIESKCKQNFPGKNKILLQREDWNPRVKTALNDFISANGTSSQTYDDSTYVVFDFDNTTVIFDVAEQLAIFQLERMAFAFTPEEIGEVLSTLLKDSPQNYNPSDYGGTSYCAWISDISLAYKELYQEFGPFSATGLPIDILHKVHSSIWWQEFSTKMRALYNLVYERESAQIAYPWITFWFTGMTSQEVYELAYQGLKYYSSCQTTKESWHSPQKIDSLVGSVSCTWLNGISVTPNIKELYKIFYQNGIKVWICSASAADIVRAGVDLWGLHEYVTGIMALENKSDEGKYLNNPDYDSSCGWLAQKNGTWEKDIFAIKSMTHGSGKVSAIRNVLEKHYGHGPAAGFMDSTGDFNFCTEFKSLQLVVCFNRADRHVTDGGGLVAEVAHYQNTILSYDLEKAKAAGDTLYLLQGRDENGWRSFLPEEQSIKFGATEKQLFASEANYFQYDFMVKKSWSVETIFKQFSKKTISDEIDNHLGFDYGFLDDYSGYHFYG